ncbi:MAG: M61 family metallopeptidase [Gemmatimonadota bacterium]
MFAFWLSALLALQAPETVYEISFPNAVHHEARITVTFAALPPGPLELRMSRSSPGRYALHEFAKNVYDVRAFDGAGRALTITRPNEHEWNVSGHGGHVRVSYTLFADHADGTYSGIDNTHAHLNMPATFMFARGLQDRPIRLRIGVPEGSGWRVATQLAQTADPLVFTAPDLQYFFDSPTEVSAHAMREWSVAGRAIRLAIHHTGTDALADSFATALQKIVLEQRAIFGELPRFDYGRYTFIADYLPWVFGDGMEHRNSTILASSASLASAFPRLLGTGSHEFFHAWNVERLRPRSLEPFDFERANMSEALWFAEGFTSYFGPLAIKRAGYASLEDYARAIGAGINAVLTAPGRHFFSPIEMSMQAPFVDAATSIDATNRVNTFISYYTYGAAIGLGLDLLLRIEKQTTLDTFMRAMWRKYGSTEIPYTMDDWRLTLGELTKDTAWANGFYLRHVAGKEPIDYETLLGHAGLLLRKAEPGVATLGPVRFDADTTRLVIAAQTLIGSPLYEAGLDRGDVLLTLDGQPVVRASDVARVLGAQKPGDRLAVTFEQRGERKQAALVLEESEQLEVVTYEAAGMPVSASLTRLRQEWLD